MLPASLMAVNIGEANVGGSEIEFADERWRAEDGVGSEAIGDVAAVAVDILAHPELAAGGADFIFDGFGFKRRKDGGFGGGLAGGLRGLGGRAGFSGPARRGAILAAFLLSVGHFHTSGPKEHFKLRGRKCRNGAVRRGDWGVLACKTRPTRCETA